MNELGKMEPGFSLLAAVLGPVFGLQRFYSRWDDYCITFNHVHLLLDAEEPIGTSKS